MCKHPSSSMILAICLMLYVLLAPDIESFAWRSLEHYFFQAPQTDRGTTGLVGPVKSVKTRLGEEPVVEIEKYLPSGNLSEWNFNDARTGETQRRQVFVLDVTGRKIKSIVYASGDVVVSTGVYFYDTKGKQVATVWVDQNKSIESVTISTYGADDKLRTEASFNAEGGQVARSVYTYNTQPKRVKKLRTEIKGNECLARQITRLYGENDLLLEEVESESDQTFIVRRVYTYSDKPLGLSPLSQSNYDQKGQLQDKWVMDYDFDSRGNWTRRAAKSVVRDGRTNDQTVVTKRTITYYSEEELQDFNGRKR